uniref:Uncharacterized protein n=1 Tax=Rhizophora mucronata TaxID=61149 RepID=A0A2P2K3H3_RHIMU
MVLSAAVVQYQ